MKRILSLFAKNLPLITKRIALFSVLYTQHRLFPLQNRVNCAWGQNSLRENIIKIQQKSIKIYQNGRLVGYAFCFTDNYLVTVSQQLFQRGKNSKSFEYYMGGQRLKGNFKVIGSFQNLVFIEYTQSEKISVLRGDHAKPSEYTEINIMKQKQFTSLKKGFFINEDSGYGIIDGEGQIGSIIINQQGAAGIVVQVGKQSSKGFLRMVEWRHLPSILQHVKGKPLHLGISAQAVQNQEGVSVVRIAPNSPFKSDIMMGDLIVKANGHRFRDPESLHRICVQSSGSVDLVIQRQGKQIEVKISL